ncbi:hypothetical protein SCYAM73S_06195 [Streptomyces cyaneofuscatus]
MTPNAASASSAPSRRSFLASTAVATAAVAGGMPLLSACGGSDGGSREGTTSGKDAKKILPAYVAEQRGDSRTSPPRTARRSASPASWTSPPSRPRCPKKLGKGGKVTIMAPFWGSPPKQNNPYYKAMNDLIGVDVVWQNQDGNTYDQKLGAVLASSDVPDVVVVPGWNMGGKIPSAIISKFADLGPYLSGDKVKEYPNLAAIPTDAWQRSIFGGKLRGLPHAGAVRPDHRAPLPRRTSSTRRATKSRGRRRVHGPVQGDHQRQGQAVGLPGHEVDRLADLRGPPGSEKPLGWNLVDGKLVNRIETQEYLEALEWSRKLFAAGVVHPDVQDGQDHAPDPGPKFAAGEFLIYPNNITQWWGRTAEQATQNPDFKIWGMDVWGHDGGDPTLYDQNPAGIFAFVSKKASESVIRDVLAVANVTAAPYGTKEYMMTNYGVEGTHYTVKDVRRSRTERPRDLYYSLILVFGSACVG